MQKDYFTFPDILAALVWLIIIIVAGYLIRNSAKSKSEPHYKYFMPNLYAKLFFSFVFALVYVFYYGGGDTTAYFDGAIKLNNLFIKSPGLYYQQMISEPNQFDFSTFYDSSTGYPPGWIYREPEAFFVCKLISLFSFLSFKSYLALTFMISFIVALASWKLFETIRSFKLNNEKHLAFGVLLLPSVNFWCSGVSKDTLVFIAIAILIHHAFIFIQKGRRTLKGIIIMLLAGAVIYHIRSFVLVGILAPLAFAYGNKVVRVIGGGSFSVIVFRLAILVTGFFFLSKSIAVQSEQDFIASNSFVESAAIIQGDFATNTTYGTNKYSIGDIEFTPLGLLRVSPFAILAGVYRPFLWESLSPTLIMNGLESMIFLYFTFLFFKKQALKKIKTIGKDEFLIFCLIFIVTMAFITGLTSGLLGVLVRLRAPLLPFFFVLLTLDMTNSEIEDTGKSGTPNPDLDS